MTRKPHSNLIRIALLTASLVLVSPLCLAAAPAGPAPESQPLIPAESTAQENPERSQNRDDQDDFIDTYPGKLIPFAGMAVPIAILWIIFSYTRRSNQIKHETIQKYLEKGVEVPRELLIDGDNPATWPHKPGADLRKGLIWTGVGLGLGLTAYFLSGNPKALSLGLLFLFIGAGYFIAWKVCPRPADDDMDETTKHV